MKALSIVTVAAATFVFVSCSKENQTASKANVPETVLNSFKSEHPAANEVEWSKEGSNFEVEFEENKTERSNIYDPAGKVIEKEIEIKTTELLPAINDYIKGNYDGYEIEEAVKKDVAEGTLYEVEIEKKDVEKELIFDNSGKFIKEEVEEENDEKEGEDD